MKVKPITLIVMCPIYRIVTNCYSYLGLVSRRMSENISDILLIVVDLTKIFIIFELLLEWIEFWLE